MKLEDIVCSVELSKKLVSLGVKQKSIFLWRKWTDYNDPERGTFWKVSQRKGSLNVYDTYPAYTASELFSVIPSSIHGVEAEMIKFELPGRYEGSTYGARYLPLKITPDVDKKMENAIANLLVHLIENKLMEIP